MSRDDILRETLRRATRGEPSTGDAFARFGAAKRRSLIARGIVAVGAGVAAMIALFMVLPGGGGEGVPGAGGPQGTQTPLKRRVNAYTDKVANFRIEYPGEWGGRGTQGSSVALFPRNFDEDQKTVDYTSSTIGAPEIETPLRFYVIVRVLGEDQGRARLSDIDAQEATGQLTVERGSVMIGDRPGQRRFLTYKTEEPPAGAQVQTWCVRCSIREYLLDWVGNRVLDLRFVAPDAETLTRHAGDIEDMIESFVVANAKAAA